MRNDGWIILLLVAFLLLLGSLDCSQGQVQSDWPDPVSCFPTDPGTIWNYRVTLGGGLPIISRCYSFPTTSDTLIQLVCHQQLKLSEPKSEQTEFALVLQVARKVEREIGGLSFSGVQLRVVKDELGLYRGKEACLYWAITTEGNQIEVIEVITCFSDDPLVADLLPEQELSKGFAAQYIFVSHELGTGFGVGEVKSNVLYAADWYGPAYQLVRICHSADEDRFLYREQLLFREGEGLVRLIQTRNDTLTMQWDLIGLIPG